MKTLYCYKCSYKRTNTVLSYLYKVTTVVKFVETESEWQLPGTVGRKNEELFNESRVSVLQDGKQYGNWLNKIMNVLHYKTVHLGIVSEDVKWLK